MHVYVEMYHISGAGSNWPNIRPFFDIQFWLRQKSCKLSDMWYNYSDETVLHVKLATTCIFYH